MRELFNVETIIAKAVSLLRYVFSLSLSLSLFFTRTHARTPHNLFSYYSPSILSLLHPHPLVCVGSQIQLIEHAIVHFPPTVQHPPAARQPRDGIHDAQRRCRIWHSRFRRRRGSSSSSGGDARGSSSNSRSSSCWSGSGSLSAFLCLKKKGEAEKEQVREYTHMCECTSIRMNICMYLCVCVCMRDRKKERKKERNRE